MSDYTVDLETGCWVWRRAESKAGYGQMYVDGKMVYAHREYYEAYVAPDGERQCRECNRIRGRARGQRWAADFRAEHTRRATKQEPSALREPEVASIPLGKCQCGCGADTKIAKKTISAKGIVKGQPMRYLRGHAGNWREQGGYAIDVFYQLHIGPIPDGHQIDHICANERCVNPAHLAAVTALENVHRARRSRHAN